MKFNVNTEGAETRIVELGDRYLDLPGVYPVKIISIIGGVANNEKKSPGIEIVYQAAGSEDFESYEEEFPSRRTWITTEKKHKIKVDGPIASVTSWVGQSGKSNALDVSDPNSAIQKFMQISEAADRRKELDEALKSLTNDSSVEDFGEALHKALSGSKVAILLTKNISERVVDNTLKEYTSADYAFGTFAVPVGEIQDLRKKFEARPDSFTRVTKAAGSSGGDNSSSTGTQELVDF